MKTESQLDQERSALADRIAETRAALDQAIFTEDVFKAAELKVELRTLLDQATDIESAQRAARLNRDADREGRAATQKQQHQVAAAVAVDDCLALADTIEQAAARLAEQVAQFHKAETRVRQNLYAAGEARLLDSLLPGPAVFLLSTELAALLGDVARGRASAEHSVTRVVGMRAASVRRALPAIEYVDAVEAAPVT
jgi:hypothetical protein